MTMRWVSLPQLYGSSTWSLPPSSLSFIASLTRLYSQQLHHLSSKCWRLVSFVRLFLFCQSVCIFTSLPACLKVLDWRVFLSRFLSVYLTVSVYEWVFFTPQISLTLPFSLAHTYTHTLSLSHSLTHTLSLSHPHPHPPSYYLSHYHRPISYFDPLALTPKETPSARRSISQFRRNSMIMRQMKLSEVSDSRDGAGMRQCVFVCLCVRLSVWLYLCMYACGCLLVCLYLCLYAFVSIWSSLFHNLLYIAVSIRLIYFTSMFISLSYISISYAFFIFFNSI